MISEEAREAYFKKCASMGIEPTDLQATPKAFSTYDQLQIDTTKEKKTMPEQKEDEKPYIMIPRKLFKDMVEKLRQIDQIEDMTDVEDVKELLASA